MIVSTTTKYNRLKDHYIFTHIGCFRCIILTDPYSFTTFEYRIDYHDRLGEVVNTFPRVGLKPTYSFFKI